MEVFIAGNIFVGKITHTEEDAFKNTLHISIDIVREYLTDYNALHMTWYFLDYQGPGPKFLHFLVWKASPIDYALNVTYLYILKGYFC